MTMEFISDGIPIRLQGDPSLYNKPLSLKSICSLEEIQFGLVLWQLSSATDTDGLLVDTQRRELESLLDQFA